MSASLLRLIAIISVIYSQLGGYVFPVKCGTCSSAQALRQKLPHVLGFIIPPKHFIRPHNSPIRLVCMEYLLSNFVGQKQFNIKMYYIKTKTNSKSCSSSPENLDIQNENITNYRFGWTFEETWLCDTGDIDIEILYECVRQDDNIEENGTWIRENASSIKYETNFQKLNASLIKNCTKTEECECPLQCTHASLCGTLRLIDVTKEDVVKGKSHFTFFILLIIFILFIGLCAIYFNKRNSAVIHPINSKITQ